MLPVRPTCNHDTNKFKCKSLTMKDNSEFHSLFYRVPDKKIQDQFILKYVKINIVQRRRERKDKGNSNKSQLDRTTKYFVRNSEKVLVPVCMDAFLNILHVSRFRVNRITKAFHNEGFIEEKRGGFKQDDTFRPKRECIMNFINRFHCVELHYCRGKTARKYLLSELNVKKMWDIYSSNSENLPVKTVCLFRHIFNTCYNLSFDQPRKDVCSTCLSLTERKKLEQDPEKKQQIEHEKTLHKLRFNAFYELLKDTDPQLLIFSYDCQKNLP